VACENQYQSEYHEYDKQQVQQQYSIRG